MYCWGFHLLFWLCIPTVHTCESNNKSQVLYSRELVYVTALAVPCSLLLGSTGKSYFFMIISSPRVTENVE